MTRQIFRAAACVTAFVAATASVRAQSTRIDGGVVSTDTYGFYWETHLTPPVPPLAEGFGTSASRDASGVIHRVLLDRVRKVVFGYDVRIDPIPGTERFRLTFEPPSLTPDQRQRLLGNDFETWKELPSNAVVTRGETLKAGRVVMNAILRGQVLELNLLTTESGQTLTDYVTIQQPSRRFDGFESVPAPVFHFTPGPARDFALSDVQLELVAPRLTINGKPEPSSERVNGSVRGTVVWFYLPKRGRYVLSLLPRSEFGFRRAGEVRGSTARFTIGNETFTLLAADQIAPGRAPFTLYVFHDPEWKPTYANANVDAFILDAADRAQYVVGQFGR
jgi:hypothetical protein